MSKEDTFIELFNAEELRGNTIDAIAIIYQKAFVAPPPPSRLAPMIIGQFKQGGPIGDHISLSPTASIDMREATIDEAVEFHFNVTSVNNALASMLTRQLHNKDLSGYTAISLRGDTMALGTIWFAVAAR